MSEKDIQKLKRDLRMKTVKDVVRFAVIGLVETFVGAATNSVLTRVEGGRLAKFGAKAGGFLTGMYIGEQVADYICGTIDDTMADIEELKRSMEENDA